MHCGTECCQPRFSDSGNQERKGVLRCRFLLDQTTPHPQRLVSQPSIQPRQKPVVGTGHGLDNRNDKTKLIHGGAAHNYDWAKRRGLFRKTGKGGQPHYGTKWLQCLAAEV